MQRWQVAAEVAADQGQQAAAGAPPGGGLSDPGSTNSAAAAGRRLHCLADLARRQIGQQSLTWTSEMQARVRGLRAHTTASLAKDMVPHIEHAKTPSKLALLGKLEAAKLKQQAKPLHDHHYR